MGGRGGNRVSPTSEEVETKAGKLVVRKKNLYDLCVYQLTAAGGGKEGEWRQRVSPTSEEVETKATASRHRKNPKLSSVCVSAEGSWGGDKEYPPFTGGRDQGDS